MTSEQTDTVDGVPRSRIVLASMVGTTVEFYDFYVYATAAVSVFPFLFFPKGDPTTALLASLATFGLAFVADPVIADDPSARPVGFRGRGGRDQQRTKP